jgi:hypothetical protein
MILAAFPDTYPRASMVEIRGPMTQTGGFPSPAAIDSGALSCILNKNNKELMGQGSSAGGVLPSAKGA